MTALEQAPPLTQALQQPYRHGFVTDVESDSLPAGLDADTVRAISLRKREPAFWLAWRLAAFERWQTMSHPHCGQLRIEPVDFQALSDRSTPKSQEDGPKSLADVDPMLLETYEKFGVPLHERARLAGVAVDAVFVGVGRHHLSGAAGRGGCHLLFVLTCGATPPGADWTLPGQRGAARRQLLRRAQFGGVLRWLVCRHPQGRALPDGAVFVLRINAANTGQFERTLIIAEEGSHVSHLEGCTAPRRDEHQLHAAAVELIAHDDAHTKYSTVQNWYPGDEKGRGGIYNFVTKRGPRHFGTLPAPTHQARGQKPKCGDDLQVAPAGDHGRVSDIRFNGQGCAICIASAPLMTEAVLGQVVAAEQAMQAHFRAVLTGQMEPEAAHLGKLISLDGVRRDPGRMKCALLGWRALMHALADPTTEGATGDVRPNNTPKAAP